MYNNNDGFPPYSQQEQGTKLQPRKPRLLKFLMILAIITTTSTLILMFILIGILTSNHGSPQKVGVNPSSALPQRTPTTIVTPTPVMKTYQESRTLTCTGNCGDRLLIVLNKVVVDATRMDMVWYFTITDNGSDCGMSASLVVTDPAGKQLQGDVPGTLTQSIPISTGQSQERYTTVPLVPKPDTIYFVNFTTDCNAFQPTYQTEQLMFN